MTAIARKVALAPACSGGISPGEAPDLVQGGGFLVGRMRPDEKPCDFCAGHAQG